MNKIEAIIQPFRLDQVREALLQTGVEGITVSDVKGHGRQKGHPMNYRGQEYSVDLLPKVKIEIVVNDVDTEGVIAAICSAARTGQIGDGKIFVYRVPEVFRIRNEQRDEAAL